MAILPKITWNGVRVKTLKINGNEAFESTYKKGVKDIVKCYHKHKGIAGQESPNGCYTVKENYGGSCGGHTTYSYTWAVNCGRCGTYLGRTGDPNSLIGKCPNNACAKDKISTYDRIDTPHTSYCSSSSTCNNWKWQTRYVLGCGYDAE